MNTQGKNTQVKEFLREKYLENWQKLMETQGISFLKACLNHVKNKK